MGAEDFVKLSVLARTDFRMTRTSPAAELAFYRGLQYCGLNATGGVIPIDDLNQLGPRRAADELVANGYWDAMPNGWAFRQWDKWQGEYEQVSEKRRREAARKREERRRQRDEAMFGEDS